MSVVAPITLDFGQIDLNFYFLFFIGSITKTKIVAITFFRIPIFEFFYVPYTLLPALRSMRYAPCALLICSMPIFARTP